MSAAQLQASSRIVEAMGSMVYDTPMVDQVINYIINLREEYPAISKAYLDANTVSTDELVDDLTKVINDFYDQKA